MSSKNIKGITIEIGGDTTKLGKELEKTEKQSKSLQKELNGVNTLLKYDPKNVTLVQQKQELLNKSIETTKSKLDTLKATQAQVQAQFDKGEITEEQYRDFQREIVATEQKLKNLTDQAKDFAKQSASGLKDAGEKVQKFGNKTTEVGKSLMPLTAGITVVGATAVASMDAVDEGLDTIATKTGATGEQAKEFGEIYKEILGEIPAEFGDVGAAIGEINTRLDFTGNKLKVASTDFLKFAKVNGIDVNSSVQLVTRAMGDAGIAADDYASLLDMLTIAGQKSGISIDSLATNLAKYGAPMRALGIDTENAIAMFAGWEKAGVNTEIAFSGMKKAISNWGAAGKDSTKEFAKTLEEIKKCPDIASATTKAIEVFGAKAGPDLADAIKGGRFEFETYIEALKNSKGAVESTYGAIVDEVDDAQVASQNFKVSMHDLGETISKIVGPILKSLSEKLKAIMDKFNSLSPEAKQIIVTIAGIVAVVGPLIMLVGSIITGIGSLITAIGTIKTAVAGLTIVQNGLNLSFLACPITWIVLAIAALVAAFVVLWNKCEWFRNFWIGLWEGIKTALGTAWTWMQSVFNAIVTTISAWVENIKVFFTNLWNAITTIFSPVIEFFQNIFSTIWNCIVAFVTAFIESATNTWNTIMTIISPIIDFIQGIVETIWSIITSIINVIILAITAAWEGIKVILTPVIEFFQNIWNGIVNIFNIVATWFGNKFNEAWNNIKIAFSFMVSFFSGIWNGIVGIFNVVATWFGNKFKEAWNNIKNAFSAVGSFFSGIWNTITGIFTKIGTTVGDAIGGAFKNVVNSIISFAQNTINGFIRSINWAIGAINNIPGVNITPLRELNIPKLKVGMANVPYDNYLALLHKGERVLTAEENKNYNKNSNVNQVINNEGDFVFKVDKFYNNRKDDVKSIAQEMGFYEKQYKMARGGVQ